MSSEVEVEVEVGNPDGDQQQQQQHQCNHMIVDSFKLRLVADVVPKDIVIVTDCDQCLHANSVLLALCSDYFEGMLSMHALQGHRENADEPRQHRVSEVEYEDLRLLVDYSMGKYVPSLDDINALLRVQHRFIVPTLRNRCVEMLRKRAHSSFEDGWEQVASAAASYEMWDLMTELVIMMSRRPWTRPRDAYDHFSVLWKYGKNVAPPDVIAAVIESADFACVYHKFWVWTSWLRAAGCRHHQAEEAFSCPSALAQSMWPDEVPLVLKHHDVLDRQSVVNIALASSLNHHGRQAPRRVLAHSQRHVNDLPSKIVSEARYAMAKVDATITASFGPGTYQMILISSSFDMFDQAYFSRNVVLNDTTAREYHVYLEEETDLDAWWRHKTSHNVYVLIRHFDPHRQYSLKDLGSTG